MFDVPSLDTFTEHALHSPLSSCCPTRQIALFQDERPEAATNSSQVWPRQSTGSVSIGREQDPLCRAAQISSPSRLRALLATSRGFRIANDEGRERAMTGANALTAGLLLIAVSAIVAAIGAGIGYAAGNTPLGLIAGMAVGLVTGFWAVWKIYVIPMRTASLKNDYSHLKPQWDDDE